jgi:hypothetical protein
VHETGSESCPVGVLNVSGSNMLRAILFYYMVTVISDRDTDLVEERFYSQINKMTKGKVF